jgi:hypothetical protein
MNTPVSFEIAKLLKEKGYPFEFITVGELKEVPLNIPTIAEVVMWLYKKHGIWIGVQPNQPYLDDDWCFAIFKDLKNNNSLEGYNSPTEAYEAAIKYCLTNLIKEHEKEKM